MSPRKSGRYETFRSSHVDVGVDVDTMTPEEIDRPHIRYFTFVAEYEKKFKENITMFHHTIETYLETICTETLLDRYYKVRVQEWVRHARDAESDKLQTFWKTFTKRYSLIARRGTKIRFEIDAWDKHHERMGIHPNNVLMKSVFIMLIRNSIFSKSFKQILDNKLQELSNAAFNGASAEDLMKRLEITEDESGTSKGGKSTKDKSKNKSKNTSKNKSKNTSKNASMGDAVSVGDDKVDYTTQIQSNDVWDPLRDTECVVCFSTTTTITTCCRQQLCAECHVLITRDDTNNECPICRRSGVQIEQAPV